MMPNICVIGTGNWGMNHVRTLAELNALGGIVETDASKRNEIKNTFQDVKVFETVSEAIEYGFDGYTVATPPESHFSIGKKVIDAGFPVLIEKPMTLNVDEGLELVDLANRKNLPLMVGHLLLFHPAIRKIKSMIEEGKIGNLQYIYSNRLNLGQVRTEENVFWSFAPHDISIFQYFVERQPIEIFAKGSSFISDQISDTTIMMMEYPENISAHIFVSWLHPFKEHRLVVIGSEGMITFVDSDEGKPLKFHNKSVKLENGIPVYSDGDAEEISYEQSMPLTNELEYFLECVNGKMPEIADGNNGVEVLKILQQASKQIEG
jgi:UDP-2-acetamido-3-amino-2,3-dideoxy-glucuronate N-acetyltransferase